MGQKVKKWDRGVTIDDDDHDDNEYEFDGGGNDCADDDDADAIGGGWVGQRDRGVTTPAPKIYALPFTSTPTPTPWFYTQPMHLPENFQIDSLQWDKASCLNSKLKSALNL